MGKHVFGPFHSLATPKNGRKWHKKCPFFTKKSQAWQACFWLNQIKWKRFHGPYDIYIHGKTCVRALLLLDNSQKWPKNVPFLTKKSQAWQACSWLNQTKWKRFNGPYDIYIDGKTCVRALLLIGNSQKWQKWPKNCPFLTKKKPSMAGLLLTQPNQMETR